jgi:xanthine dehydrogenase YagR molybdenum-binding subunit
MASQIWGGIGGPPANVTLKLNNDGSVIVLGGTQDLGTGTYTFLAQIVSEVLEIPIDKMQVIIGDTSAVPYGPQSGGSITSPTLSPAARDAAEQMKSKIISGASAILDLPEDQLVYKDAVVYAKDDKSKSISIPDLMRKMHEQMFITNGTRSPNPEHYALNTFGVQFAEVEVDTETGKIKVLKIVAAHDIGRVLNWKTCENQFHGGIIQGLGFALMEERILDFNTCKVLNTNFHEYKIPTIKDIPEIEIYVVSTGDSILSNTGVKGMAEPAIIPTAAAIANAVYNAIGKRMKSLPMTPDKVLNVLYS